MSETNPVLSDFMEDFDVLSECDNAEFLQCSDLINVNTLTFPTYAVNDCISPGKLILNQIIWYRVLGTGEIMTISTCNSAADYLQEIHVYDGVCSSLFCVVGDGDSCSGSSLAEVSFTSIAGIIYYVVIGTFDSDSGGDLTVELNCGNCIDRGDILISPPNNFSSGDNYIFETNETVIAENLISSGADIEYDGKLGVGLNANFEVDIGSIFHAYTEGCGN